MIRVLLSALIFLFPLGIYCLILGRVNRRRHPVMVSGLQDCAGLLLALSGFFFFVGPSILTGFNYRPRDIWLYNHYGSLAGLGHHWWWVWATFGWFAYAAAVAGGASLLLWRRRRATAIYNVEPDALDHALARVLTDLGLEWARSSRQFYVGFRSALGGARHGALPAPHGSHLTAHALVNSGLTGGDPDLLLASTPPPNAPDARYHDPLLAVESWPALRHVTVHWAEGTEFLRQEIEPALGRALAEVRTNPHPVGTWLTAASAFLFVLMFFLTVLFQLLNLNGVRVGI